MESGSKHLQAAVPVFLTDGTVATVRCEQKLEDHFPVLMQFGGVGADHHFMLGRRGTGGDHASALVFHHTHTTRPVNGHIGIITKGWYMDSCFADHLQDIFLIRKSGTDSVNDHIFF